MRELRVKGVACNIAALQNYLRCYPEDCGSEKDRDELMRDLSEGQRSLGA